MTVRIRWSDVVLALLGIGSVGAAMTFVLAWQQVRSATMLLHERAVLVERLGLTDLALFTEARYTRHPTQADRFSAFQDHPFAFDHFPSGSLIAPPTEAARPR